MQKNTKPILRDLSRESVNSYVNVEELPINQPKSPELLAYYGDAANVEKRKKFKKALSPQEIQEAMHKYVRGTLWYNEETKTQELYYPTYNDLANEYQVSVSTLQKYGRDGEWSLLKKSIRMNMNRIQDEETLKELLINVKAMESRQLQSANELHRKLDDLIDRIDPNDEDLEMKDIVGTIKSSMEVLVKLNDLQEKIVKKEQLQDDIREQFKALAEEKQKLKENRRKRGQRLIKQKYVNPEYDNDEIGEAIKARKEELKRMLEDGDSLPIRF